MARGFTKNKYINCGDVTLVCLSNGKFAKVDTCDVPRISEYKWMCHKGTSALYARTHRWNWDRAESTMMHRMLMNAPVGVLVDHINHNGLDNRKSNLRLCNHTQNAQNTKLHSSKYKGVYKCGNRWQSHIRVHGELKYLGSFESANRAALAYNDAALKYFGEYAYFNEVNI